MVGPRPAVTFIHVPMAAVSISILCAALYHHRPELPWLLATIYAASCAWRASIWVQVIERTATATPPVPSWIASPFVDRTVATVGEVSLGALLSLQLTNDGVPAEFAWTVSVLATLAQVWCWVALYTGDSVYHIPEETMWMCIGLVMCWRWKVAILFVAYLAFVDVPQYVRSSRRKPTSKEGIYRALTRTDDLGYWTGDLLWRPLYFVVVSGSVVYVAAFPPSY
jgi:hypothetical protein